MIGDRWVCGWSTVIGGRWLCGWSTVVSGYVGDLLW